MKRPLLASCLLLAAVTSGCSHAGYWWQAARGQLALWHDARPVAQWLGDPATPAALRDQLVLAQQIRTWASTDLALPDNGSYRRYARTGRPYVVWNVVAAPALSVEPLQWCFPIAGCVTYKGWFAQADAQAFGARLAAEGHDVFVYGVPAYSTLGWFDDPLLDTFVHWPRVEVARLVFHELAHQRAYAPGDSLFNESYATAVEREGVRRWVAAHGDPAEQRAFDAARARRARFVERIVAAREALAGVYASGRPDPERLAAKARILATLRAELDALEPRPDGAPRPFLDGPLGNAHVAAVATYDVGVPAFERLLAQQGGDLPRFHAAVERLARGPDTARVAFLQAAVRP
ncbi:MAG: aminopeptidase [Burkholderiales bacterium]|nr:aminopeptidase [Burkholderiales bacterium]